MTKENKIILITGSVFMAEALIHYNIGVNKDKKDIKLEFPSTKELIKIGAVVLVFSVISAKMIKTYTK
tara:strand:- start:286 stop:489 length:204 start_codon:yes stop_codon:yes gene_type:complete